jgi:hypothetical protein
MFCTTVPRAEFITPSRRADSLYSGGIVVLYGTGLIAWYGLAGSKVRYAVAIRVAPLGKQAQKLVLRNWAAPFRQQATNLIRGAGLRLR